MRVNWGRADLWRGRDTRRCVREAAGRGRGGRTRARARRGANGQLGQWPALQPSTPFRHRHVYPLSDRFAQPGGVVVRLPTQCRYGRGPVKWRRPGRGRRKWRGAIPADGGPGGVGSDPARSTPDLRRGLRLRWASRPPSDYFARRDPAAEAILTTVSGGRGHRMVNDPRSASPGAS